MLNKKNLRQFDTFFFIKTIKKIVPIKNYSYQNLNDFVNLEDQKKKIIDNNKSFSANKHSNNILLWGERGTGKSSLILSSIMSLNKNKKEKIKIIELLSVDLKYLPEIMYNLEKFKERFIIFIDDIMLESKDKNFKLFKVILEGSLLSNSKKIKFYVTSNIRNIALFNKKTDQNSTEIKDQNNNFLSLSDRFGLKVGFYKPTKEEYLKIIYKYLDKYNFNKKNQKIEQMAMQWSIDKGSFSGRVAHQFVKNLSLLKNINN